MVGVFSILHPPFAPPFFAHPGAPTLHIWDSRIKHCEFSCFSWLHS
eukprot:UN14547